LHDFLTPKPLKLSFLDIRSGHCVYTDGCIKLRTGEDAQLTHKVFKATIIFSSNKEQMRISCIGWKTKIIAYLLFLL